MLGEKCLVVCNKPLNPTIFLLNNEHSYSYSFFFVIAFASFTFTQGIVMKWLALSLIAFVAILQYKLWFEADGIQDWLRLRNAISLQNAENLQLTARNNQICAEIEDLKQGEDAIQEHARNDLGMINQGEVFYQVLNK